MTREEIVALIGKNDYWYHQIEVAPGIVTPGGHPSKFQLEYMFNNVGFPQQFTGLRVLDLGARDGFFSFETEKRGAAEVTAVDYMPPDKTGFNVAAEILGSKVKYITDNVYNVTRTKYGTFDVVLFLGLLYHLRNPMLVLDNLRELVKDGGMLFVETQLCDDPQLNQLKTPAWQYFAGDSFNNDGSNKWGPNMAGLKAALLDCQFETIKSIELGRRGFVKAKPVHDEKSAMYKRSDSSTGLWR